VEEVEIVGGDKEEERKVRRRKREKTGKDRGRERKVEKEKAKQTEIWAEWKKEMGKKNNKNF
jgi:hypothetical protein